MNFRNSFQGLYMQQVSSTIAFCAGIKIFLDQIPELAAAVDPFSGTMLVASVAFAFFSKLSWNQEDRDFYQNASYCIGVAGAFQVLLTSPSYTPALTVLGIGLMAIGIQAMNKFIKEEEERCLLSLNGAQIV
jgi:hypothetical protein